MIEVSHGNGGHLPTRVSGVTSQAVVQLLSSRGVPANELVVTRAERRGNGEGESWVVTVLRGRKPASHEFPQELVDRVLARGPCDEWYAEVSRMLEAAGMSFPA